jgi:transcriptional/translational regulatory protein YebC/TACO1
MELHTYETYGPGGVAILIEALTDNKNKAAQEIKHILAIHELELAAQGSASWAFKKTHEGWEPTSTIPLEEADIDKLAKLVDDLENNDEVQSVFTNAE